MYAVSYTKDAVKTLRKLPRNISTLLVRKINEYALDPDSQANNTIKMTGRPGYRLRAGDWRVLFTIDNDEMSIQVLSIGPRGRVYK